VVQSQETGFYLSRGQGNIRSKTAWFSLRRAYLSLIVQKVVHAEDLSRMKFIRTLVVLNIYGIAMLTQDADNDVQESGFFYMQNVVIVESVTRESIEAAAQRIAKTVLK
jgi:hypothetical protein